MVSYPFLFVVKPAARVEAASGGFLAPTNGPELGPMGPNLPQWAQIGPNGPGTRAGPRPGPKWAQSSPMGPIGLGPGTDPGPPLATATAVAEEFPNPIPSRPGIPYPVLAPLTPMKEFSGRAYWT